MIREIVRVERREGGEVRRNNVGGVGGGRKGVAGGSTGVAGVTRDTRTSSLEVGNSPLSGPAP